MEMPDELQADPAVAELLQEQTSPVAVPVKQDGPWLVHQLPSRTAPAYELDLTTTFQKVDGANHKRKRMTLLADAVWRYSHSGSSRGGVRWPANVPLVVEHSDDVYARVDTGTGVLSVIVEVWAD